MICLPHSINFQRQSGGCSAAIDGPVYSVSGIEDFHVVLKFFPPLFELVESLIMSSGLFFFGTQVCSISKRDSKSLLAFGNI